MMQRGKAIALLLVLPAVAYAPLWLEERLLAPEDGTFLHYPLRALAFGDWHRGEPPVMSHALFGGTAVLSGYRAGVLYPLMPALSLLPPFVAFQLLVLVSLAAAGALTYLYLRRLGAHPVGAYVGGLSFALGPYLVNHLGDTATVVASPLLPLVLLAAEAHARRASAARAAGLSLSLALLFLAGSPEAARAGLALVLGRLVLLHARPRPGRPTLVASGAALLGAVLLAAPQLLPTFFALREAGRAGAGIAADPNRLLPGATGLVLLYVSHTPAPALALAALPLVFTRRAVRALLIALLLCVALRYGRGPLVAPGTLALVFDFTLALLAGLSLSAQWEARREAGGRRLRTWLLFAGLAGAAALSVAASALGPLPQGLAGAVGVLAVAFILYVALAGKRDAVAAGVFLLPLTAAFLLQPHGREVGRRAPTRAELAFGTPARQAVDRALGARRGDRMLTLVRDWPYESALDLGFGNLASVFGRTSATGYDPLVRQRVRDALFDVSAAGILPGAFFRSSPSALEARGVRLVQAPVSALTTPADADGLGERLDLALQPPRPRFFPLPNAFATEIRLATWMSDAVAVPQGETVALVTLRLASGRERVFPLRAGLETAEWAYDRGDVRPLVRHERARVVSSFAEPKAGFEGHRYLAVFDLGGRYRIDGLRIERTRGPGQLFLYKAGLADEKRLLGLSVVSAYLSDAAVLREIPAAPTLRLYTVRGSAGPARVVDQVRVLADDAAVRKEMEGEAPFDPRREALITGPEAARAGRLLGGGRSSRAEVVRAEGRRLEVRAEGPGLLVLQTNHDPGWSARVDGAPAPVLRVNELQMGVPLPEAAHRVTLRFEPRGLRAGLVLAALGALGLALSLVLFRPPAP